MPSKPSSPAPSRSTRKTNVILIILDTHRADRLGCYGYPRGTSPNLDAFARSSILFENAVSPAQWTIPSHASMFTGLPPSTHRTTQANSVLDDRFVTFAELLSRAGYETVGFCNNPLVGLIHNNLRRGFREFYNYSGTTPNVPRDFPKGSIYPLLRAWEWAEDLVRRLLDPIQNKFATSNELLQAATNPIFVPLWTRLVHFKGFTARSVQDVTRFLSFKAGQADQAPFLLFLNLMETHLPFLPPREFVNRFVSNGQDDRQTAAFMRSFNAQAMQWLIPLKRPFNELEARTLSDYYDAEVAYQDHLLGKLLAQLERPGILDNSLVIIAADHGEMLGEHQFMGHGFGVHKELVNVPLMIRLPGQREGWRVAQPVLTTRLFQTVLHTAGIHQVVNENGVYADTRQHSLVTEFGQREARRERSGTNVISEAYAPQDAMLMMERREPELIDQFHTRQTHRAVFSGDAKLYDVEGVHSRLLTLGDAEHAPAEETRQALTGQLERFLQASRDDQPEGWQPPTVDLSDPSIEQRLRDLGYMA
ncbi:MAG: sulfatase [Anaerolineaceae bacterium]|nr:sulfatase [Anaerolineaceae bacterium]